MQSLPGCQRLEIQLKLVKNSDLISFRSLTQGLTHQTFKTAEEAVSYMGCVQAQEYSNAKWGLALRTINPSDVKIEDAFKKGMILRSHLLRPTWHFVTPKDIRWILKLCAARLQALNAYHYRLFELDAKVFKRTHAILEKELYGKQLARDEIKACFQKAGIATNEQRFIHLMYEAELSGIVCSGARKGKQFTYALLDERVPAAAAISREEAIEKLCRIYFRSHGPATAADYAWWSGMTMKDALKGISGIRKELNNITIDKKEYFFSGSFPKKIAAPPVLLLPAYDEYTVAYKDRSAMLDAAYIKRTGNGIFKPVVLFNGRIAGTWKRSIKKETLFVELECFSKPDKYQEKELQKAAADCAKFYSLFPHLSIDIVK